MNFNSDEWKISEKLDIKNQIVYDEPRFYEGSRELCDLSVFYCQYNSQNSQSMLSIWACVHPAKWSAHTSSRGGMFAQLKSMRTEYGDCDSKIRAFSLSIVCYDLKAGFRAFLTVENTDYEIVASGLSQREFAEFLISVCEAPHPETRDVIDYILDQ